MDDDRQRVLRALWERIRGLNPENVRNYPSAEEDIQELAASGAAVGLHEDLLSADPTGGEGRDLFA